MKLSKRQLRTYLLTVSRGADRSPLFWWMVEHYAETAKAAQGKRMPWTALCAQFAAFGLIDGHGKPPSKEAARRTWRLVRIEMAKVQAAPAMPASQPKPRYPPGRQPPIAAPKPVTPQRAAASGWLPRDGPPAAGQATAPGKSERPQISDEEIEDRFAELRRTFAERSGH